jgi:hypothetical protein
MCKSLICCLVLVGATVLVGCKKDEAPEAPVTLAPPPATQPAMPDVMPPPATAVVVPAVTVPEATTPVPATVPAAPVADATSQSLLAEVEQDIKDKKWDDAEAALKKLETMKDKLPPDWLDKLKELRTAITAGKAANGLKIPGFGQ